MDICKLSKLELEIIQDALEDKKILKRTTGTTAEVVDILLIQAQIQVILNHKTRVAQDNAIVARGLVEIRG